MPIQYATFTASDQLSEILNVLLVTQCNRILNELFFRQRDEIFVWIREACESTLFMSKAPNGMLHKTLYS